MPFIKSRNGFISKTRYEDFPVDGNEKKKLGISSTLTCFLVIRALKKPSLGRLQLDYCVISSSS